MFSHSCSLVTKEQPLNGSLRYQDFRKPLNREFERFFCYIILLAVLVLINRFTFLNSQEFIPVFIGLLSNLLFCYAISVAEYREHFICNFLHWRLFVELSKVPDHAGSRKIYVQTFRYQLAESL